MESKSLIPIGSKIEIFKSKIRTNLPQSLLTNLPRQITAEVIDYKITDGKGIGYVLMTDSKFKIWIFSNELNEETKKKYDINDVYLNEGMNEESTFISQYVGEFKLNGDYTITYLFNPINLIKWSLYTLKDIF